MEGRLRGGGAAAQKSEVTERERLRQTDGERDRKQLQTDDV